MPNYQAITIIFAFYFVSSRFLVSFASRLHCFKLTNKIAFLAAFLAVSRVFSPFVCVCLYRHKRPLFWPLLRLNFSMHPQPLNDPHRDRGCLSELFFLKIFSSLPALMPILFFFIFLFSASCVVLLVGVLYLTTNSHFRAIAIYFSEYEQGVYLTAI